MSAGRCQNSLQCQQSRGYFQWSAPLIWARFLGRNHCGRENVDEIAVDKMAVGGLNLATRPSLILLGVARVLLLAIEYHQQHHLLIGVHLFPALLLQQHLQKEIWIYDEEQVVKNGFGIQDSSATRQVRTNLKPPITAQFNATSFYYRQHKSSAQA